MSDPSNDSDRPSAAVPGGTGTPGAAAAIPEQGGAQVATETAKADLGKRFLALLIDAVIAAIVSRIPWIGGILAALYILFRDGFDVEFMDHRSIGKRIMHLRPLTDDGSPVTLRVSATRNWPLVVTSLAIVLLLIPLLGWILIPLAWVAGLILLLIEGFLTVTDEEGRRWGDRLAGTRVVETDR
ncbi:MAG: RDD family protein [Deinococcales bacterium]|jgi:uncharacterized RDD family membrane protein YckC